MLSPFPQTPSRARGAASLHAPLIKDTQETFARIHRLRAIFSSGLLQVRDLHHGERADYSKFSIISFALF